MLNILLKEKRNLQSQLNNFIKAIAAGIISPSTEKKRRIKKIFLKRMSLLNLYNPKKKQKLQKKIWLNTLTFRFGKRLS